MPLPNTYGVKPLQKPPLDYLKGKIKKIISESKSVYYAFDRINELIGGFGVEPVRGKYVDNYWQDVNLLYVNKGDTYEPTVVYDTVKNKWYIGVSWGSIVESDLKRFDM